VPNLLNTSQPCSGRKLRLGTRGSPLALAQARELMRRLAAAHASEPEAIEIVPIKTAGDTILHVALREAGGKGLFTKELDQALLAGAIGAGVHSAKDLPAVLPDGIAIAGYLPREDVRDAWISPLAPHPSALAAGSTIGTASLRRAAMVKRLRPDVKIALLRGNVETRLAKIEKGEAAGTLLALAGLKRLGLEAKASCVLDAREFVPAAGQGAIAVTVRSGDEAAKEFLAPVLDHATAIELAAERAFLRVIDGSCKTPIGANARLQGDMVSFHAIVLSPDGSQYFEAASSGPLTEAGFIGASAGHKLLNQIPAGFLNA